MIVLRTDDLHDQAGMERAFAWYFENVGDDPDCAGTFNTILEPSYERCSYQKRTVVISVQGKHWMSNPGRMLHGGITASVLDLTMGLLCRYCSGGHMTPTIDLNVSYLKPAPYDRKLYIEAEVTRLGFSVCHAVSRMWAESAENTPLATGSASYFVTQHLETDRKNSQKK